MHKSETEEAYSHKGSQSIAVRCVDDYTAHRGTEVLALQISHTTDALCGDRKYWQSESSLLGIPS